LIDKSFLIIIVICTRIIFKKLSRPLCWNDLACISHESERFRNKAFQPEDVVFYFEG